MNKFEQAYIETLNEGFLSNKQTNVILQVFDEKSGMLAEEVANEVLVQLGMNADEDEDASDIWTEVEMIISQGLVDIEKKLKKI
jgi:trimethylamine:corrinoid methyltransferase-like protein